MQPGAGIPRVPSLDFLRQLVGHQFNPSQFSQPPAVVPKQEAPQSEGQDSLDKETVAKAEVRRARRMLSNRESARRSRRRKQEHLSTLEDQLNDMQRDKDELFERLQRVESGAAERDRELHRLRQENAALKHQLEDGPKRPASAQKGIPRVGSWHHLPVEEQPPRKRLLSQADRDSPLEKMVAPEQPVPEPQQLQSAPSPVPPPPPVQMPNIPGDSNNGQLNSLPQQQAAPPAEQPALDNADHVGE
ncbi:hypothetical protein WJX84_004430 [Apatococcus fuscideae]|uniref:BZIP domain-containing protein n=1 Tax=Apatococcus fuscideae TaxID=2026836 RepID=A0AAW1SVG1_9CHLO